MESSVSIERQDDPEESAVQDFLTILEEHRRNCERQGKYAEVFFFFLCTLLHLKKEEVETWAIVLCILEEEVLEFHFSSFFFLFFSFDRQRLQKIDCMSCGCMRKTDGVKQCALDKLQRDWGWKKLTCLNFSNSICFGIKK